MSEGPSSSGQAYVSLDQQIHFQRSDGNPTFRPPPDKLAEPSPTATYVDWMREVNIEEQAALTWRKKIGEVIKKDRGLDSSKTYCLAQWPESYKMYAHHKGNKDSLRTDYYLFGAPHGNRYRSANEFLFHAQWLLREEGDETPCGCKYCTGQKLQRIINYKAGIGPATPSQCTSPSSEPSEQSSIERPIRRPRQGKLRVQSPFLSQSSMLTAKPDGLAINRDRDSDLRSQRWFRTGEVAWCPIEPPIVISGKMDKIEWWPCVIQDPRLKIEVRPDKNGGQYSVAQTPVYRLRLLGLSCHYIRRENQVIPWLAYQPSENLKQALLSNTRKASVEQLVEFCPMANPIEVSWNDSLDEDYKAPPFQGQSHPEDASSAYSIALAVASKIIECWSATDRWTFRTNSSESEESLNQIRFQGLWWGGERIWVGDLVRIKLQRKDFLAPELLEPSPLAEERCLFVRINAIYLADSVAPGGKPDSVPMFCGPLLEVAKKDYQGDIEMSLESTASLPSNTQLSTYPLPTPILARAWRAVTPTVDHEVHFPLNVISGRYYPSLIPSHLICPDFNSNPRTMHIGPTLIEGNFVTNILSLGGVAPGDASSFSPLYWRPSRTDVLTLAHRTVVEDISKAPSNTTQGFERHKPPIPGVGDSISRLSEGGSIGWNDGRIAQEVQSEEQLGNTAAADSQGEPEGTHEAPIEID